MFGAGVLFGLFLVQFVWPDVRIESAVAYIVFGLVAAVAGRRQLGAALTRGRPELRRQR